MFFVAPKDFLENYNCSECLKILSVTPIKVYPNRLIKCGRCTKNDDGGTVSVFQNLAKLVLFKCVNRFEGCQTLLTSSQVQNHEKECLSKEQLCPICVESTNIPTYYILQHFKIYHRQSTLENTYVILDIEETLNFNKILLYRNKDYLFFIYIKFGTVPDSISFQIVLLGEHLTTNIVLKFFIRNGDQDVENSIDCRKENGRIFVFENLIIENNRLRVVFELKEETIVGKIVEVSDHNKNNSKHAVVCLGRKLFIEENLQKLYSGIRVFNTELNLGKVIPFCYVCSELFIGSTLESYTENIQWCIQNDKFQYVCLDCKDYFECILKKTLVEDTPPPITFDVYNGILYFCTWNCNSTFTNKDLLLHEMSCSFQPLQECPFDFCQFKGILSTIKDHFEVVHKTTLYFESYYKNIIKTKHERYFYINGYFIKLLHTPTDRPDHNTLCLNDIEIDFFKSKPNINLDYFFRLPTHITSKNYMKIYNGHNACVNSSENCKIFLTTI